MKGKVMQIYCLDKKGYWTHRCLFINADDLGTTAKLAVMRLKGVYDTSSTIKEVQYNVY